MELPWGISIISEKIMKYGLLTLVTTFPSQMWGGGLAILRDISQTQTENTFIKEHTGASFTKSSITLVRESSIKSEPPFRS